MHGEHKNKSVENQPRRFHPMPAKRRERGLAAHLARFWRMFAQRHLRLRSVLFQNRQFAVLE